MYLCRWSSARLGNQGCRDCRSGVHCKQGILLFCEKASVSSQSQVRIKMACDKIKAFAGCILHWSPCLHTLFMCFAEKQSAFEHKYAACGPKHFKRSVQPAADRLASVRCKSGQGVSTSDSQPDNNGSNDEAPDKDTKHAHERNTSWTRMVMALPLELAAVTSRTDNFYLRKRKRKHWWSREHFPKVSVVACPKASNKQSSLALILNIKFAYSHVSHASLSCTKQGRKYYNRRVGQSCLLG